MFRVLGLFLRACVYQELPKEPPPPKNSLAAIGSPNDSRLIPGVAAPTNGVVSCLYIAS